MALTEQQMSEIRSLVLSHHLMDAIRLVRGYTGWGLSEAKDFVEAQQELLRRQHPERFRFLTPPPIAPDDSSD